MQKFCRNSIAWLAAVLGLPLPIHAEATAVLPEALRGVNPDLLSGGVFSALDAAGAFGPPPSSPPRARASYPDVSKGRPPAVLDVRVGANLRLGDDPDALPATQRGQAEAHLVRSPANPNVLLAAFQEGRHSDAGAIGCGYSVSRDGGFTWTRALIPNLTTASGGRFIRATDPVCGAGPQGDLYLQTLASVRGAFELAAVVVSRSTDNGATWSAPVTVFESTSTQLFPDKNWLAVNDYPSAPNSGRLVTTWTNFLSNAQGAQTGTPVVASVSDDRGLTWSAPIEITPPGSSNQGTQPVFLPDGSLVVVYTTFLASTTQFAIHCKRSTDGGRTFPGTASTVVPFVAGWDDPDVRDGLFLTAATVARQTGELFVTYTAVVNGSPRVLVTKSSDQGASWTSPVVASDQPAGVSVMNPAITASPDGRTVAAVFMDKRNAADGRNFVDHYAALSFDGGVTWQPNLRLTEMSSDIRYGPATSRGIMIGDYIGIAPSLANDQPCVAIWCDTRTGDSDPFTVRFAPTSEMTRAVWERVRVGSDAAGATADGDELSTLAEYIEGADPTAADFGDNVVTYPLPDGTLAIAIATRATPDVGQGLRIRDLVTGETRDIAKALPALRPDELPAVSLRPGLSWWGAKILRPTNPTEIMPVSITVSGAPPRTLVFPVASSTLVQTNARLINLATRGRSGSGASQMIVGFVIDGPKTILVRAAGPALAAAGVTGALADPRLTLSGLPADLQRANDNWQDAGSGANAALFARVGAFPFGANSRDAALALQLGPLSYTAIVSGPENAAGGVALVEAYDADANPGAPGAPRLVNLSTRGEAGAGENALIAGFVIAGTQPRRVLIRAAGPALEKLGVGGVLADPVLTLFRGSTEIARNDDWEISRSSAAIAATAHRVGAFPLNSASLDAALLMTLAPGAYTTVITGADGGTGIALVEVYDAD